MKDTNGIDKAEKHTAADDLEYAAPDSDGAAAENPEATLYDYRFRESGPLRGLPILPTFGIRGSF